MHITYFPVRVQERNVVHKYAWMILINTLFNSRDVWAIQCYSCLANQQPHKCLDPAKFGSVTDCPDGPACFMTASFQTAATSPYEQFRECFPPQDKSALKWKIAGKKWATAPQSYDRLRAYVCYTDMCNTIYNKEAPEEVPPTPGPTAATVSAVVSDQNTTSKRPTLNFLDLFTTATPGLDVDESLTTTTKGSVTWPFGPDVEGSNQLGHKRADGGIRDNPHVSSLLFHIVLSLYVM